MKLLIWMALGWFIVHLIQRSGTRPAGKPRRTEALPEPMVRCAHCGIHLPVSESVSGPGTAAFCSGEHRRLHLQRSA